MRRRRASRIATGRALTPEARRALEKAGITRRSFLKGAGALIVSFSMSGVLEKSAGARAAAAQQGDPRGLLDSWIAVTEDGRIVAYTGKVELGTGILTAQTQLVAEELYVPIERVTVIQGDTALTPNQGVTAGSQSHPTNFNPLDPSNPGNWSLLTAAATAREALLQMASQRFSVPVEQLTIQDGVISVKGDPSKRVSYGELVGGRRFDLPINPNAKPKDPREWTIRGTSVPRIELPAMVTGRFEYIYNVHLPDMVYGAVVRPPVVGAKLVSIDNKAEVESRPGNVRVIQREDFVGVVADTRWHALEAAKALRVTWSKPSTPLPKKEEFFQWMQQQPASHTRPVDSGDVDQVLARAAKIVEATYYYPYQMHASMGTGCAVADVRGGKATVYSHTQDHWALRNTLAMVLGLSPSDVRVIYRVGAGCYGLMGADTAAYDAAVLSQAVGKPVYVQLTRKDEMAWENYGYPYVIRQRAGLDGLGNIIAWDHESWRATKGGRPGNNSPGNVVTGTLLGFSPATVSPSTTIPNPPLVFPRNGSNHVPSYVTGRGRDGIARYLGVIESQRVIVHTINSPFFTGPLRSPDRLQNTFAHESFMDELAAAAGADPVEFRLRHLNDVPPTEEISGVRLKEVIRAAARLANWDPRPSPKPGNPRTGVVTGRGIACCLYEGDNGYVAVVAEVEVDQESGHIVPKRFFVGHDCGPITNPDGLKNQIEGGLYQGMSRALVEEVTWDDEKITSIDWLTYPVLTFGFETPRIEVALIDRRDVGAMGAGETTITVVAAAIANAVFDATGARLRQVPFTPERVKAALAART